MLYEVITPRLGIDPGSVQAVARPELEGLDPGEQVVPPLPLPAAQVVIAGAAVVGVDQRQAAAAAAAASYNFV